MHSNQNPNKRRALHLCCVILNQCVNALWNYANKVWGARNLNAIRHRVGSASNTYCSQEGVLQIRGDPITDDQCPMEGGVANPG